MAFNVETRYNTFPSLGRMLAADDVGKMVVRVRPHHERDFGFIPYNSEDKGYKLVALHPDKVIIGDHLNLFNLDASWMDNGWLTVDEFRTKTVGITAVVRRVIDSDPPY